MEFSHPQLQTPVYIPFCRRDQLSASKALANLEKVLQSNAELKAVDMEITATSINIPGAAGLHSPTNLDAWLEKHSSGGKSMLFKLRNKDKLCVSR